MWFTIIYQGHIWFTIIIFITIMLLENKIDAYLGKLDTQIQYVYLYNSIEVGRCE